MEEINENKQKKNNKLRNHLTLLVITLLVFSGLFFYSYYLSYKYESVIGSYMDNAYDVNTPEKMLEQLNSAKNGMINEGLTENDYGAFIFKKPDNSMEFQYKHMDSIIERVIAVQEWKEKTYGDESNTQTESLGDVYESKMTNLRNFIMEDVRSDWIAKDAWYIKNHLIWYLFGWIAISLCIILLITLGIIILHSSMEGKYS